MPYQKSTKLPGEFASKLGHLGVVQDPFIKEMLSQFESRENPTAEERGATPHKVESNENEVCNFILAFDGSISTIPNGLAEHKKISYINVATICLDMHEMREANKPIVDPFFVKDLLKKNSDTMVAALPLSGFYIKGKTISESIREAIFHQIKRYIDGQIIDTLKFLIYREWNPNYVVTESFECIHENCGFRVSLPKGQIEFDCPKCKKALNLIDYIGILSQVNDESNSESIAVDMMNLLEHTLIFYYLRNLPNYTNDRVLLIKDGPLMLRAQYARLVQAMRDFLEHFYQTKRSVAVVGVEKTGSYVDHIPLLRDCLTEPGQIFVPDHEYRNTYIKNSGPSSQDNRDRSTYGAKVYFKADSTSVFVLNIPTGGFRENPTPADLKNLREICSTLPELKSYQFENSLAPIAAAHRIASMSMYPSNAILERFTKDTIR